MNEESAESREKSECKHEFVYKSEAVKCCDVNKGWFDAKRVVVYCENCGRVSHDVVNSDSSYSQDYSHK